MAYISTIYLHVIRLPAELWPQSFLRLLEQMLRKTSQYHRLRRTTP